MATQASAPIEPDVDPEATQQLAWRVPRDVALLFAGVRETLRARLGPVTDGVVFDAMLDGALRTWTLREPGVRRPDPVIERDGCRCAVPGCTSRRNLHDHHVRFRSAGGSDTPGNRITLCAFHHLRCLHAGRLRVCGRAPRGLVFELGVRRGAPPWPATAPAMSSSAERPPRRRRASRVAHPFAASVMQRFDGRSQLQLRYRQREPRSERRLTTTHTGP